MTGPLLTCPACGAEMNLAVLLGHEGLRNAMVSLARHGLPLGAQILRYVGLFRPARNRMSPDRLVKLMLEIQTDIDRGAITHRGRDWSMSLDGWRTGLETMAERVASGSIELPLTSHQYLYTILAGLADKQEAQAEAQEEHQRRVAPRRDTVQVDGQVKTIGDALDTVFSGRDPALAKLDFDTQNAAPMPADIKAKLALLKKGVQS